MRYSKSLDLIIAALNFGQQGKMEKAAMCFDKALTMKDLGSTLATLDKAQANAHTALVASLSSKGKKTTAQLMAGLAAKRKAAKAKKPFPGAAPLFKKKAKADFGKDDADEGEDEDEGEESFDDVADDMTKASVKAKARSVLAADDEEDEDLDLDNISDDAIEMPEASFEDIEDGFTDRMEETEPGVPSVDGEGQPGEGFTETSESDAEEESDEEEEEASVQAKVKRVQANVQAMSRLTKITQK